MGKQLFRSRQSRILGGVAGGVAEYFDIDPVLVRVIFIVTTIGYGVGIFAYIIMWIIVPERKKVYLDPEQKVYTEENYKDFVGNEQFSQEGSFSSFSEKYEAKKSSKKMLFGSILIILGGLLLLNNIIPEFDFDFVMPLIIIGIGALILIKSKSSKSGEYNEIK